MFGRYRVEIAFVERGDVPAAHRQSRAFDPAARFLHLRLRRYPLERLPQRLRFDEPEPRQVQPVLRQMHVRVVKSRQQRAARQFDTFGVRGRAPLGLPEAADESDSLTPYQHRVGVWLRVVLG